MPPSQDAASLTQLGVIGVILLVALFYGGTMIMSVAISKKKENADAYMTAGNRIGFGVSAASMTATWIWAASMYASVTAGYTYGVSGPLHYGLWGDRRELMVTLLLVSVLMAMTTALVGPMTFLGFLVATLAYSLVDTHDHRFILPVAALAGYAVLTSAYFVLRHVFYAGGAVTVVIELIGGITFLVVVMRKGRL